MRFRNTLLAFLALAGLGAFIYYYEYRGEETRGSANANEKNVFAFERDKAQEIGIAKPGSPALTLHREAGQWKISAPIETRADPDKVSALLSSLSFLRVEHTLEGIAESEMEGFKLKEPAARVTIKLSEGSADLSLALGDKTPIGSNYYAQKPGSRDVLLVSADAAQILSADPASLRYKKVIGADVWKVARFRIERGSSAVTFARGTQGDEWKIESPISFPAESSKVQGLWMDLEALEADSFESENPSPEDLRRFGLDASALHVTVWIKPESESAAQEATPSARVAFSAPGARDVVYARRDDMPSVMKIKNEILDRLGKPLESITEYRDSRAAPLDRWKLAKLDLQRGSGPVILVKDQESSKWRWGAPDGIEMPSEEVNPVLDAIETIKATGYLDSPDRPGATQEDALLTLTLTEGADDSSRSITMKILPFENNRPDQTGLRRVTSTAASCVYLVPASAVKALLDRVSELVPPKERAAPLDPNASAADPNAAAAEKADQ